MTLKNDHTNKIIKIKVFLMVFGPNKRARRVLRLILHKNRCRRRFDFSTKNGPFLDTPGSELVNRSSRIWKIKNCFEK